MLEIFSFIPIRGEILNAKKRKRDDFEIFIPDNEDDFVIEEKKKHFALTFHVEKYKDEYDLEIYDDYLIPKEWIEIEKAVANFIETQTTTFYSRPCRQNRATCQTPR